MQRVSFLISPVLSFLFAGFVVLSVGGAACNKSSAKNDKEEAYKDIEKSFDDSEPPPEERKPVDGADLKELSEADRSRFDDIVDKLPSPCGAGHSLRTSRNLHAKECVRAPFAVDYVLELIKDGANNKEVKDFYELRYGEGASERHGFKLEDSTPHSGPADAQVVLVEFYDYGCPACAVMKPVLEEIVTAYPTDVVLYYKMFPLASHKDSGAAAQAALAASKQGRFKEMHAMLFENQFAHKASDLTGYAKAIGLNMTQFEADMAAAKAIVDSDRAEGERVGIAGTPSLYINGSVYQGPDATKYMKMWIDEALAAVQ